MIALGETNNHDQENESVIISVYRMTELSKIIANLIFDTWNLKIN